MISIYITYLILAIPRLVGSKIATDEIRKANHGEGDQTKTPEPADCK
jgi:hypothetical protein